MKTPTFNVKTNLFLKIVSLIIAIACSACASVPQPEKESIPSTKTILFPSINEERVAQKGEPLVIFLDYESAFLFRVEQPINQRIGLGRVEVSTNDPLAKSTEQDSYVFCPFKNVYSDVSGWRAPGCLVDSTKSGYVDTVRARPGPIWLNKKLGREVRYVEKEEVHNAHGPVKREVLFDAYEDGNLLLTYREFTQSLTTPSLVQPIRVSVVERGKPSSVKGVEITILESRPTHIRYKINKAWSSTLKSIKSAHGTD